MCEEAPVINIIKILFLFRLSEFLDISQTASISDWKTNKRKNLTVARGDAVCCSFDGWFINFGGIGNDGKPTNVVDALNIRKSGARFEVIFLYCLLHESNSLKRLELSRGSDWSNQIPRVRRFKLFESCSIIIAEKVFR